MVVLVIALVIFGPRRVPELGRSLGKGIREFKDTLTSDGEDEGAKDDSAALPRG
jgi:sec-independent protein translocase protein TatA